MTRMLSFFITMLPFLLLGTEVLAAEGGAHESSAHLAGYAIAAALAIGLPALGGALGQGRAAAAALEGIARNPSASGKIFVPMILGMALIESLVLFGLILALMLVR